MVQNGASTKGDAWGGGGHFETATRIALNHCEQEMALAEGFRVPRSLHIHPFGEHSGWGEDAPVWPARLERDGWIVASNDRSMGREKPHPIAREHFTLRMTIYGVAERNEPWYLMEHRVVSGGTVTHDLGQSDWADWDASGDLLFARDGSLYRLRFTPPRDLAPLGEARQLIDRGDRTFTNREAPASLQHWPRKKRII